MSQGATELATMTFEEVATLLHVSQTYVQGLTERGDLPVCVTETGLRKIARNEVIAYKKRMNEVQKEGLALMIQATERAGLYEREAEECASSHLPSAKSRREEP